MRGALLALVGCLLAAPSALAGPLAFEPAGTVPAGSAGRDLAAVDLTRDGRPDLVLAGSDGRVGILAATGPATYAAPFSVPAGGPAALDGLAVGLVDGDDQPDVVVINTGAPNVQLLRGNGSGLGVATVVDSGGTPSSLLVTDLDADGDGDIAVADSTAFQSHVLRGDGAGGFPGLTNLSAVAAVRAVAAGDVTGDGLADLHLAGDAGGYLTRNQGSGSFAAGLPGLPGGTDLAVGDVTGDGLLDRVSIDSGPARVVVAAGLGAGSFAPAATTGLPLIIPTDLQLADLDGDARLDVVVTLFDGVGASQVAVLRGGGGALEAPILAPAGVQAVAVAVADVDPDGRPDVVALDATGQDVVVVRNTTRFPPPLVGSAQALAIDATSATIVGTVDPRGRAASVRVEYGPDTAYGLATADVPVGAGSGAVPVGAVLGGLTPGTTYHYRLVATSPVGETGLGTDGTFTTAPPPPTASLTAATVKRTWAESRVTGAVTVRGQVSHATTGALVLLRTGAKQTVLRRLAFAARSGAFRRTLALPATLKPGTYAVELRPSVAGAALPAVRRTVRLTAPTEGVVDRVYASARRGSSPLLRLPGAPRQLWAHFRFAAAPKGRPITTTWYPPTGPPLVVPRPYRAEIHTFVANDPSLPTGRWRCVLRAGGKVVARVSVRIG
jgi:hypothetical protein